MTPAVSPDVVDSLDARLRLDLLVEQSSGLGAEVDSDILTAVRERLTAHLGDPSCAEVLTLLWAAAARQPEALSEHVADVYRRQVAVQVHGATSGHDICCLLECPCAPHGRGRCSRCESWPHECLDDAVRALVLLLRTVVSPRAVRDVLGNVA